MSGNKREADEERRLINEQLEESAEVVAERKERQQLAEREQQERLQRLCWVFQKQFPSQLHDALWRFLLKDISPPPSDDWTPALREELQRLCFLKALARDEDDITTRLVYADWLDERGEHEEADRQRKWPTAKEWLVRFCKENLCSQGITYEGLMSSTSTTIVKKSSATISIHDRELWYILQESLQTESEEFWKHLSVVTGIFLLPDLETKGFHSWRCCDHEVYYWYGRPDSDDEATE